PGTQRSGAGTRLRDRREVSRRRLALRSRHRHDGRRCRRRTHRLAAPDVLLSRDAPAHRTRPSLSCDAAALPSDSGLEDRICPRRCASRPVVEEVFKGNAKVEVGRFKGLGEMMPAQLKETTMKPGSRTLVRVEIADSDKKRTEELVERLMGKKPELRFQYIQENAEFATNVDV